MIKGEDINGRLKSPDESIFKKAYEELRDSLDYAKERLFGTSIHRCLEASLFPHKQRYLELTADYQI
jgi:hypothetical protein